MGPAGFLRRPFLQPPLLHRAQLGLPEETDDSFEIGAESHAGQGGQGPLASQVGPDLGLHGQDAHGYLLGNPVLAPDLSEEGAVFDQVSPGPGQLGPGQGRAKDLFFVFRKRGGTFESLSGPVLQLPAEAASGKSVPGKVVLFLKGDNGPAGPGAVAPVQGTDPVAQSFEVLLNGQDGPAAEHGVVEGPHLEAHGFRIVADLGPSEQGPDRLFLQAVGHEPVHQGGPDTDPDLLGDLPGGLPRRRKEHDREQDQSPPKNRGDPFHFSAPAFSRVVRSAAALKPGPR